MAVKETELSRPVCCKHDVRTVRWTRPCSSGHQICRIRSRSLLVQQLHRGLSDCYWHRQHYKRWLYRAVDPTSDRFRNTGLVEVFVLRGSSKTAKAPPQIALPVLLSGVGKRGVCVIPPQNAKAASPTKRCRKRCANGSKTNRKL